MGPDGESSLGTLVQRHAGALAAELALHAQAVEDSSFAALPLNRVREQMAGIVCAVGDALTGGQTQVLLDFARDLAARLRAEGFRLPELQRTIARLRVVLVPRVVIAYARSPADAAAAMAQIDDIVDLLIVAVGEAYIESTTGEYRHLLDEQAKAVAALRERSQRDGLTNLYHQAYFYEVLANDCERARRYGRSFTLILLDLDNFKQLNDQHGHQAGDRALVAIAKAMTRVLRVSDTLARYGGEEFAVVLPETSWEQGLEVAAKLLAACAAAEVHGGDGEPVPITCSAGVAGFPQCADDVASLVRAADRALYAAKAAGRNRVMAAPVVSGGELHHVPG